MKQNTKTKHTPEPWKFIVSQIPGPHYTILAGNVPIADLPYDNETDGQRKANAWLIEQAPAMLAALKLAKQYMDNVPEREIDASSEAYLAIESAIAKAERGQE